MTSLFFNQTKQLTHSAIGVTSGICMTNSNPWSSFVTPLTLGLVLNPGHGHGQRTADRGLDSGQRTAASTLIETRHSESLITVWTAQRHVPCWAHLPFMKGQDDTIIVRRLQAVCVTSSS